jgi:hypothetical protein
MSYGAFLKEMSSNALGAAMYLRELQSDLVSDIILPDFYDNVAQLSRYELRQGQFYIDQTKYVRED